MCKTEVKADEAEQSEGHPKRKTIKSHKKTAPSPKYRLHRRHLNADDGKSMSNMHDGYEWRSNESSNSSFNSREGINGDSSNEHAYASQDEEQFFTMLQSEFQKRDKEKAEDQGTGKAMNCQDGQDGEKADIKFKSDSN